jgi:tetratricopeptide (TPR) repeat protein
VQHYGVSEVARLLQLPLSTIRALVRSGFVTPSRGARRAWIFSFQDLVVLRKAQALVLAKVPHARIVRAMKALRRQTESGQYSLALEAAAALKVIRHRPARVDTLEAQIDRGYVLHEEGRLAEAEAVYREALAAHGDDPVLHYNLGVLLEDLGRKKEALAAYHAALRADPALADGHYNLALLYNESGRKKEAIRHLAQYRRLTRSRPK